MRINLTAYFKEIRGIEYAIAKVDVPYMPDDFPRTYAVGKDLDMYVKPAHYKLLEAITQRFIRKHKLDKFYELRIVRGSNNVRLRLEKEKKLHYQFDITSDVEDILDGRRLGELFHTLSLESESRVRRLAFSKDPRKEYHKRWLLNNGFE